MLRGSIVGPANAEERSESHVGKLVAARYRLTSLLGLGGASAVYQAVDLTGLPFALKILYPEFLDGAATRRFEHESKRLLGLSNPHVVSPLATGRDETLGHYLVMPLLAGRDLDSVLAEQGALAPESAVRVALQAARGLSAAHRVGVVHRGVKPGNFLLDRDGDEVIVRVSGFGVGQHGGEYVDDHSLSAAGNQLGPLDYAAPEQLANAKEPDERADIWGLGASLYQMLCGVAPFSHIESVPDLVVAICTEDVPHLQDRAPWVEAGLARAVHRALNRDPNLRPASMDDFAEHLRGFSGGDALLDEARLTCVSKEVRKHSAARTERALSEVAPLRPGSGDNDPLGLVGKRLSDRYLVLRLIGKGKVSSVYEVEATDGQKLAAKVISVGLANASRSALERFAREALATGDINSANVARTVDTGFDEALSMPYIITELLSGLELSAVLKKEGAIGPQVAVRLLLQGARGVAAAHARGVVHRDITPAKLFLQIDDVTEDVTVKVCDFGLSKRSKMDGDNAPSHLSLTRIGGTLGSPMYLSPEQAQNAKAVDERSDVWSLSVVLWEALSGRRMWGGPTSIGELMVAVCTEPIPLLDTLAPWVPHDLANVVHRGLEGDPNLRTSSVRAFIESLSPFSSGTDLVQKSDLVALTNADRSAPQLKVNISASAAAGMANLARGGRGGASLPPERIGQPRRTLNSSTGTNSWLLMLVMIIVVGGLSLAVGYLLHRH